MDKLTSMKVFTAVAQAGSFSAAAEALAISKAMASKHVLDLENRLGARLLNRNNRCLRLTEIGTLYRDRCQQILEDLEETELLVSQRNTEPRGTLKVTAPTSFGTFHLVPAITDFKALWPEVKVQLALNDRPLDLVEEGLDVGVRVGKLADSSLIARPLASVRPVVCGAPAYFDDHGVPNVPGDLAKHNCLLYTQWIPRGEWLFRGPKGEFSVPVSGNFEANAGDAVRIAAIQGCGLAQLATYVVGEDLQAGRLRAVLTHYEPDPIPIHAVYPHRRLLSATVRSFVEFLQARFRYTPYWDKPLAEHVESDQQTSEDESGVAA